MNLERIREYEKKMIDIVILSEENTEDGHIEADKLIISFLKEAGYKKLAKLYEDVDKWYS